MTLLVRDCSLFKLWIPFPCILGTLLAEFAKTLHSSIITWYDHLHPLSSRPFYPDAHFPLSSLVLFFNLFLPRSVPFSRVRTEARPPLWTSSTSWTARLRSSGSTTTACARRLGRCSPARSSVSKPTTAARGRLSVTNSRSFTFPTPGPNPTPSWSGSRAEKYTRSSTLRPVASSTSTAMIGLPVRFLSGCAVHA